MHLYGETPQIYHRFALFDPPKMGNLMTPVFFDVNIGYPRHSGFEFGKGDNAITVLVQLIELLFQPSE